MQNIYNSPKRIVCLDWLRLAAILMVIMCHCCDPFTFNTDPSVSNNPLIGYWGAIYQSATRFSVPLFVILTGYLLLPIQESMGAFYRKRIGRVIWPFLIWSILYNLFAAVTMRCGLTAEGVRACFVTVENPDPTLGSAAAFIAGIPLNFSLYGVHMWYIYLLLGLYLYIPIFSAWLEKASLRQKYFVLALWVISLFIPYINLFREQLWGCCEWNSFGTFYYFAGFSGYLLLGHLARRLPPLSWGKTLAIALPLILVGYAVTLIGFRVTQAEVWNKGLLEMCRLALDSGTIAQAYTAIQETFLLYCSPNVAMLTLGVLLIFLRFNRAPGVLGPLLANMTSCGFGIYLVHYLFVGLANHIVTSLGVPLEWVIPAGVPIVFAMAWGLCALLKKLVPGKWLLG